MTLNGQDITKIEQYKITRLGMGRTFQNIRLFKGLTVEENVMCAFDPQSKYSILGGLLSVVMAKRMAFRQSYLLVGVTAILMLPIALALALGLAPLATYGIIVVCVLVCMGCSALFSIFAQTYLQQQTPTPLLGKVSSFVSAICVCAMPLGQAMYGVLFDAAGPAPWSVVLLGAAATLVLVEATRRILRGVGGAGGPAAAPSRR